MTSTKNNSVSTNPTLVLGARGKTGRRIVSQLKERGQPVRLGSRSALPAFDWHVPSEWRQVIQGASAIYISYHPDLATPGATDSIETLAELAKEEGVGKIVLLSGRGEEEAQLCEQIVLNSGIPSTVLRSAWFNQNFSESFMRDLVVSGTIALPANSVREPFLDVDDIADVAIAALNEDGHEGRIYELTGPELLSFPEVAFEISKATGRSVRFQEISPSKFTSGLRSAGLPDDLSDLIAYLFCEVLDGRNEYVADGVERALGRAPRSFRDFADKTASTGLWSN